MTGTVNFFSEYEQREKRLSEANTKNKETVFAALAEAKVTRVCVTFDGEGDSGQIEDVTFYRDEEPCEAPSVSIAFEDVSWNETRLREKPLSDAIESLCYDYLSQYQGGWENNDGAFGEFTLFIADRRIELDFNARFSDFTTFSHTF